MNNLESDNDKGNDKRSVRVKNKATFTHFSLD